MNRPSRAPDDPRCARIELRSDLLGHGLTDRAIAALVRDGTLHRVRHGAYVDGAAWLRCDEIGRHGLRARAVLRQARTPVVLTHLSAAAEWGVPLWDVALDDVHLTRRDRRAGRHEAGVRQHLGQLRDGDTDELHGVTVTSPTRTALDCAAILDTEHGVTIAGDLLHRGLTTRDDLAVGIDFMTGWPGSLRHRMVLGTVDARCESVGEHRALYLFFKQGLRGVHPQFEVTDGSGRLLGRVDFAFPDLGVFVEFDGREKYQKFLRPGETVTDAVLREKRREEEICRITGWRCLRISWADLYHPERVAAQLRALAGSTRHRAG